MTKAKYATTEERRAALSDKARKQMLAQWEADRHAKGMDRPGYFGCHRRVRQLRGPAREQVCVDCGEQARHWAHIHDTDPGDAQNYQAMCQKCHFKYDDVAARSMATKGEQGRSANAVLAWSRRTPEQRRAILEKAWETRKGGTTADDAPADTPPRD